MEMSESNLPESEIRSPIQIQLINDFENKIIVIDTDDMIELIVKALSSKLEGKFFIMSKQRMREWMYRILQKN